MTMLRRTALALLLALFPISSCFAKSDCVVDNFQVKDNFNKTRVGSRGRGEALGGQGAGEEGDVTVSNRPPFPTHHSTRGNGTASPRRTHRVCSWRVTSTPTSGLRMGR